MILKIGDSVPLSRREQRQVFLSPTVCQLLLCLSHAPTWVCQQVCQLLLCLLHTPTWVCQHVCQLLLCLFHTPTWVCQHVCQLLLCLLHTPTWVCQLKFNVQSRLRERLPEFVTAWKALERGEEGGEGGGGGWGLWLRKAGKENYLLVFRACPKSPSLSPRVSRTSRVLLQYPLSSACYTRQQSSYAAFTCEWNFHIRVNQIFDPLKFLPTNTTYLTFFLVLGRISIASTCIH